MSGELDCGLCLSSAIFFIRELLILCFLLADSVNLLFGLHRTSLRDYALPGAVVPYQ
jgi:hypothetical protein